MSASRPRNESSRICERRVERKELKNFEALLGALRKSLVDTARACARSRCKSIHSQRPFVILVVGVNGSGKTTTIGKLARHFTTQGLKVMLAAGDTFRAAAIEQLETWGRRNGVPVIAQQTGADPAAVIFDALQAARARGIDVLIADTAGRLQTQSHLMDELKKVKRVIQRLRCERAARDPAGARCGSRPEQHRPGRAVQSARSA